MRSLLSFTILLVVLGYVWGIPKIALDGMDSFNQGESMSQPTQFQNLKGLRIDQGKGPLNSK